MASRQVTTLPVKELTVANGNWDTSRKTIDRVVIHTMVGTIKSADARFNNSTAKVSAHYGVGLDGSIVHWVDEDNTAYHAGSYDMNQRSIGIEHEDNGKYDDPRPDILYTTSAKLVRDICKFYNIPIDRTHIIKHSEVIATGCPDALDIDRIVNEAQNASGDPTETIKTKDLVDLRRKETAYNIVCDFLKLDKGNTTGDTITTAFEKLQSDLSESNRSLAKVEAENLDLQAKLNQTASVPPQDTTTGDVPSIGDSGASNTTGGDTTGSNTGTTIPVPDTNPSGGDSTQVGQKTGQGFDLFAFIQSLLVKVRGWFK